MHMELHKVYEFDLGDMSHCRMSHDEMCEHYRCNSSPLSFLMEKLLPKWFVNLVYDSTSLIIECNGQPITIRPDLRDKQGNTSVAAPAAESYAAERLAELKEQRKRYNVNHLGMY